MGITNTIAKLKAYFEAWHTTGENLHLDLVYPVGSIYMSVNDVNPKNLFGGEWQKIEGRFLLGSGTSPENNNIQYTTNNVGGNKDAIVVSHNHGQNKHNHVQNSHYHENSRKDDGYKFLLADGNIAVNSTPRGAVKETSSGDWHYVYAATTGGTFGDIVEHANTASTTATNKEIAATNIATGESGTNKNMPPYIVVNIWQRIR